MCRYCQFQTSSFSFCRKHRNSNSTKYPCDKYDLQLHKITVCTLEQNIHVTNASAKLVKLYMNVQDKSAVIVQKVRSGSMKKLSMKTLNSYATYVYYKQT